MSNAAQYIALGRDIRHGLGDIGDAKLQSAQLNYQLGRQQQMDKRQAEMDALQRPIQELASTQAQTQLGDFKRQQEMLNAPVQNIGELAQAAFGDMDDRGAAFIATNNVLPSIAKVHGWKFNGKTYTLPDGSPITRKHLFENQAFTKAALEASVDPGHALNDMIARAEEKLPQIQDPQQKAQAVQALNQMKQQQNNPRWLLNAYNKTADKMLQGIQFLEQNGRDTSFLTNRYERLLNKAQALGDRLYVDPMQKAEFDMKMKMYQAQIDKLRQPAGERAPSPAELKMQAEQAQQQQQLALRNAIGRAGEAGINFQARMDESGTPVFGGQVLPEQKEQLDRILADSGFKAYYKAGDSGWFGKDHFVVTDVVPIFANDAERSATIKSLADGVQNKPKESWAAIINGVRIRYGAPAADELAQSIGFDGSAAPQAEQKKPAQTEQTAPAPEVKQDAPKAETNKSKQEYNNLQIGNDGQIYDVRPDGQAVRVNLVEGGIPAFPWGASANEKTIKMGNKTYENPKYKEFLEKLKELGLYEEYAERFGIR